MGGTDIGVRNLEPARKVDEVETHKSVIGKSKISGRPWRGPIVAEEEGGGHKAVECLRLKPLDQLFQALCERVRQGAPAIHDVLITLPVKK